MHAKAASNTHNLAFAHFDILGSGSGGPTAIECMLAYVFNDEGSKVQQVLHFRTPVDMQEYAGAFKMYSDEYDKDWRSR